MTPWTVAHQAPLSMGISQARILEWVAISFSRESSRPRDGTYVSCVSCIGRWVLYHCTTWEAHLKKAVKWFKMKVFRHCGWMASQGISRGLLVDTSRLGHQESLREAGGHGTKQVRLSSWKWKPLLSVKRKVQRTNHAKLPDGCLATLLRCYLSQRLRKT